jgi:uncharacterized glyoxalase superfamily protein PhnB
LVFPANRSVPEASIIPELAYEDAAVAAKWLCAAFGFSVRLSIGTHRVQLSYQGGNLIVTDRGTAGAERSDHRVMVRVTDVDAHYARSIAQGARIIHEPETYPYGERQYSVLDFAGHRWTFTETLEDVDPTSWGGTLP